MIEPVARLRIELREIEPKVWRRVDVPLSSTLLALHDIIQVTFGWMNSHLFEFEVGDRVYGDLHNGVEPVDRPLDNGHEQAVRSSVGHDGPSQLATHLTDPNSSFN